MEKTSSADNVPVERNDHFLSFAQEIRREMDMFLLFAWCLVGIFTVFNYTQYHYQTPRLLSSNLLEDVCSRLNSIPGHQGSDNPPAVVEGLLASAWVMPVTVMSLNPPWCLGLALALAAATYGLVLRTKLHYSFHSALIRPAPAHSAQQSESIRKAYKALGWLSVVQQIAILLFFVGWVQFLWSLKFGGLYFAVAVTGVALSLPLTAFSITLLVDKLAIASYSDAMNKSGAEEGLESSLSRKS